MTADADRRPLASRSTAWARAVLRLLLRTPVSANAISAFGILAALGGGAALVFAPAHPWLFLLGAALTQLRLLCNLMDGLVAVEGGRGSPTGALWNEVPDRLEDSFLLVGFGYAAFLPEAGYAAAILAVFTTYLRAVGVSHGLPQDFRGPMAKPHRMAALTAGCVLGCLEAVFVGTHWLPALTILTVALGTVLTAWRRAARIADALKARAA
ncbi:CDP-alcohol phosphatidyltransferase family protein [Aureimonas leprariae]|uniref:CDP-alcohol phosphatidyltransferase family protein n=1 Tax=Plantimonas leprariae TaxID=2615207 RepID=A0A7V7PN69_9HYPH|nr:CDP-alcohol phosphatidyltransferase family protein [Aureimonas leprariae]KAB0678821.1 CDP-alcohol phosphatidyltransferase family protein [Aureimonas leprariae]